MAYGQKSTRKSGFSPVSIPIMSAYKLSWSLQVRLTSLVKKYDGRPMDVSFASLTSSSSVLNLHNSRRGPKISPFVVNMSEVMSDNSWLEEVATEARRPFTTAENFDSFTDSVRHMTLELLNSRPDRERSHRCTWLCALCPTRSSCVASSIICPKYSYTSFRTYTRLAWVHAWPAVRHLRIMSAATACSRSPSLKTIKGQLRKLVTYPIYYVPT